MSKRVKIGILGAEGRMGLALQKEIAAHDNAELVAALTSPRSVHIGADYGTTILSTDVRAALQICDALIDFSHPKSAIDAALMMHDTPCKTLVTGTTGYSQVEEAALTTSAKTISLVKSGNFSIGICLLEALTEQAAKTLGPDWDASILDIHHHHKKDAPSGTALMLGAALKNGGTIAVEHAAQRIGDVIGEHHVSLASPLETLTLSHKAQSRSVFAAGALTATLWAVPKPNGLYTMKDVLGL